MVDRAIIWYLGYNMLALVPTCMLFSGSVVVRRDAACGRSTRRRRIIDVRTDYAARLVRPMGARLA